MDLEDAHKLKILSTDEVTALMLSFFDPERRGRMAGIMAMIDDRMNGWHTCVRA